MRENDSTKHQPPAWLPQDAREFIEHLATVTIPHGALVTITSQEQGGPEDNRQGMANRDAVAAWVESLDSQTPVDVDYDLLRRDIIVQWRRGKA